MLLFSKLNNIDIGYFGPVKFFFRIMKINNFWRDITDILVKNEALVSNVALNQNMRSASFKAEIPTTASVAQYLQQSEL